MGAVAPVKDHRLGDTRNDLLGGGSHLLLLELRESTSDLPWLVITRSVSERLLVVTAAAGRELDATPHLQVGESDVAALGTVRRLAAGCLGSRGQGPRCSE